MRRRHRTSPIEDLLNLAAGIPWQIDGLMAILSFVVMHLLHAHFTQTAAAPIGVPHVANPADVLSAAVGPAFHRGGDELGMILTSVFQYALPAIFVIGGAVSMFRERRVAAGAGHLAQVRSVGAWKGNETARKLGGDMDPETSTYASLARIDQKERQPSQTLSEQNAPSAVRQNWSVDLLRSLEWKRFEDLCDAYFKERGMKSTTTTLGADGGVDLRIYHRLTGEPTAIVQCKAWKNKQVGVAPIRELLGVMTHENIQNSSFITTSTFTEEAKAFARANRIILMDGEIFIDMIQRLPEESRQRLLVMATSGDYMTPTCPHCGIKMVRRQGPRGPFWGCKNYPKCRQMLHG